MPECVNLLCDAKAKKRGLCLTHYSRMHYSRTAGMSTPLHELCRAGLNSSCVDCGEQPFGGGMRCLSCFQERANRNRGEHVANVPPSNSAYGQGCRCRDCKLAAADYQRDRRARKRAA